MQIWQSLYCCIYFTSDPTDPFIHSNDWGIYEHHPTNHCFPALLINTFTSRHIRAPQAQHTSKQPANLLGHLKGVGVLLQERAATLHKEVNEEKSPMAGTTEKSCRWPYKNVPLVGHKSMAQSAHLAAVWTLGCVNGRAWEIRGA